MALKQWLFHLLTYYQGLCMGQFLLLQQQNLALDLCTAVVRNWKNLHASLEIILALAVSSNYKAL